MSDREPTQLDLYIKWFKNHRVFSVVLLAVAIAIGFGKFTDAVSQITGVVGRIFSSDDFLDRLAEAKKAYAAQKFELSGERFEDLGNRAKDNPDRQANLTT